MFPVGLEVREAAKKAVGFQRARNSRTFSESIEIVERWHYFPGHHKIVLGRPNCPENLEKSMI